MNVAATSRKVQKRVRNTQIARAGAAPEARAGAKADAESDLARIAGGTEAAKATAKVVAWKTLGERFAAEWPQLAPDVQARLRAEVERSSTFAIVRANPESPLYRQQLVAAFGRYCASLEATPSSTG